MEKATKPETEKKKTSIMKKILKISAWILGGFLLLVVLLLIFLSTPYAQRKITSIASTEVSKLLNTNVKFGSIEYKLFNYISIHDIYIEDLNQDTLAFAKSIDVGIKPWSYIKNGQIIIDEAIVNELYLNAYSQDSISAYNYQFLIDEFTTADSLQTDTTPSNIKLEMYNFEIKNSRLHFTQLDKVDTLPTFNFSDIRLRDINIKLAVKSIDTKALDIEVEKLTAIDRSGFLISNISGKVKSENDKYYIEDLKIETPNSYLNPSILSYDFSAGLFHIDLSDGKLSGLDFIAFLPNAKYLSEPIYPTLQANGMLPTIQVSKLGFKYGDDELLDASAFISTYEDLEQASFQLDISRLSITPTMLSQFLLVADETFEMPKDINIGTIEGKTSLKGELSDISLEGGLNIPSGVLMWDITGKADTTFTAFDVDANFDLKDLKLGKILNTDQVNNLSMKVSVEVKQETEDQLFVNLLGTIENLILKKGKLTNFDFTVAMDPKKYAIKFAKDFTFGGIDVDMSMSKDTDPDFAIKLKTNSFHLSHFIDYETWSDPILDFDLDANVKKFNIDNLNIDATINKIRMKDIHFDFDPGKIKLRAWEDKDRTQNIKLNSSILDFNLVGKYAFSTLSNELSTLFNPYLPISFPKLTRQNKNNFDMQLIVYNTKQLSKVFDLPFTIDKSIKASGKINTLEKQFVFDMNMPQLSIDTTAIIRNGQINMNAIDTAFTIKMQTGIAAMDTKLKLAMDVSAYRDTITTAINLKSDSTNLKLNGDSKFRVYLHEDAKKQINADIDVSPTDIKLQDLVINLLPAKINNTGDKFNLQNVGLEINGRSFFSANGVISSGVSDTLKLSFNRAQVYDILKAINIDYARAEIDGDIDVVSALEQPSFLTDNFSVKDIALYGDTLGTIFLQSQYDRTDKLVHVNSNLTKNDREIINFGGDMDPISTNMDFNLNVNRFSIGWLTPFVSEYLSEISGLINSKLSIKGTTDAPVTEGFLGVARTKFKVAYTNTSYFISDTINITPQTLGLKNLEVSDIDGNLAIVNANVTHKNFKNLKFNLAVRAKDLMALNTMTRTDSLFYGKVYASGNINIDGSMDAVTMNMKVNNAKNSNLYILIPQVSEATDYANIVFINTPDEHNQSERTAVAETNMSMNMNMNIALDPNIKFTIVIDPITNDKLEAVGTGNVNFKYNMQNELMTIFGDYTISKGLVRLKLQGVYNIEFKIQDGSKLQFIGDPMKTKFSITAYKRVKADLKALDASAAQSYSNSRVDVDCILEITGDIDKMNLNYNVELVGASEDQQNLFNSLVNTSDAKINQFAYLVTVGSFFPTSSGTGSNFANGMWTSIASSALSAGLNSVLTSVLGNNWNFAADITDDSKSVSASTNLINEKLVFSAYVGYKDGSSSSSSQNQFIGDFDLTYLLNTQWSLRAYSHMNNDITKQGSTIQGVGVTYTRDASTFNGLFETNKSKRRNTDRNWIIQQTRLRMDSVIDSTIVKPMARSLPLFPIDTTILRNRRIDTIQVDTINQIAK